VRLSNRVDVGWGRGSRSGRNQIEWDSAAGFDLGCASDYVGCQLPKIAKQAFGRVS